MRGRDGARTRGPAGGGEDPHGSAAGPLEFGRRDFVKLMGAGIAAAAAQGCVEPPSGRLVPYVTDPPEVTPGVPVSYATAFVLDGLATGLVVKTREGRPIKVEGNPHHPASLGASGVLEQARLFHLYDPDRGRGVRAPEGSSPTFDAAVEALLGAAGRDGARGVRLLLEPTSSPLRAELLERVRERFPGVGIHYWSAAPDAAVRAATALFGRPLLPRYRFDRARVVVSFGADFAASGPGHLRHARDFASRRRPDGPDGAMNRLYQAEPHPSPTGAVADHTLPARAGDMPWLLARLLEELGAGGDATAALPEPPGSVRTERATAWLTWAARDLRERAGECVVVAGEAAGPAAHALAHRANEVLGNVGRTVELLPSPVLEAGEASHGLAPLVAAMEAGDVEALAVLGGNPAWTAPADVPFAAALDAVETTLRMGSYHDETAAGADWFVPATHDLEAWGDARGPWGTLTVLQPLIRPLYGGRSPDELLLRLAGAGDADAREPLREMLKARIGSGSAGGDAPGESLVDDAEWERALRRGVVEGSAFAPVPASSDGAALGTLLAEVEPPSGGGAVEVGFRLDPRVHDGSFAGNPWLQELPDPVTKLTWDNAAVLSHALAERLGVGEGEPLEVRAGERAVVLPALPLAGHAPDAVTLSLGYGRREVGVAGHEVGVDCYPLRTADRPLHAEATVRPAAEGEDRALARTQVHREYRHERHQILHATLAAYRSDPEFTRKHRGEGESWYEPPDYRESENQWGMTIDLSVCTGCGACTAACQVENNIPVVGRSEVLNSREMHWIRVDRYESGPPEHPEVLTQPLPCQHCEKAPCEYVCPVNATTHSADGLNEMVYNRCVGTRFCSNNCPYKVRRFNWFDYNERRSPEETLVLNPDVTVRERGVMEKCTYCVQRIRRAQIQASNEDRPVADGEVVTACQQACPTAAIVFGDLLDPGSRVSESRDVPRIYDVLHELGTQPRTKYLAKIINPRDELYAREEAARAILEHGERGGPDAGELEVPGAEPSDMGVGNARGPSDTAVGNADMPPDTAIGNADMPPDTAVGNPGDGTR